MTSLRPGFEKTDPTLSFRVAPDPVDPAAKRRSGPMRRYEIATLAANNDILDHSEIAPATPLFEQVASAFARGTPVPTPRGSVPVEDLLPGDHVETSLGAQPVMWIGSTTYVPGQPCDESMLTQMIRVTSDAFGLGKPGFDLLLGPAARMRVRNPRLQSLIGQDSVLAPVSDYTDGDRLLTVTPGGSVQVFHLLLPRHALLEIGGLELETYHPGSDTLSRIDRDQRIALMRLFPHVDGPQDFGDLSLTRTSRDVIDRLVTV